MDEESRAAEERRAYEDGVTAAPQVEVTDAELDEAYAELLVCAGAEGKRPGVSYEALLASLEFGDSNVLAEVAAAREAALAATAAAG